MLCRSVHTLSKPIRSGWYSCQHSDRSRFPYLHALASLICSAPQMICSSPPPHPQRLVDPRTDPSLISLHQLPHAHHALTLSRRLHPLPAGHRKATPCFSVHERRQRRLDIPSVSFPFPKRKGKTVGPVSEEQTSW